MKISKLIIPVLGLASIVSASKEELLQVEKIKKIDVSHQALTVLNEPSYFDLVSYDANTTKKIMRREAQLGNQNIVAKNYDLKLPIITYPDGCEVLYASMVASCQALWFVNPAWYGDCMRAAWDTYMACRHG